MNISDRNILLYFCSSPMDYFLTLYIKYFKIELSRLSGGFPQCFQVVFPEQCNQLNYCLMQFCLSMYLFYLDNSRLFMGFFLLLTWRLFFLISGWGYFFACLFAYLPVDVSCSGRWTSIKVSCISASALVCFIVTSKKELFNFLLPIISHVFLTFPLCLRWHLASSILSPLRIWMWK